MYKCRYFRIEELVPPEVFHIRGDLAWELLDSRMLGALDLLRDRFGKITVNNWVWGGDREWSGLRTPDSPFYSPYSQHTFGRAADCLFASVSADEVRSEIISSPHLFPRIMSVELDVSWLHFDVRNCQRIKTYSP